MRYLMLVIALFGVRSLTFYLLERQFPHLIIPLKEQEPDTPFYTQFTGEIISGEGASNRIYTEILFDVPESIKPTACKLEFFIDNTSPKWLFGLHDTFAFNISTLEGIPNKDFDSWNSHPDVGRWVATFEIDREGHVSKTGGDAPCAVDGPVGFLMTPSDESRVGGYTWFEQRYPLHGITLDAGTEN
ncbi:hypothetical protein CC78DRAFT_612993 [Lojkania enalia]|uniref:Ubiquitin 3 binding protein But2 C-terminal domain-containing protein n=1 Tax=Lojkania enalia TaxID=147567 RepID=A0A9P4KJR9_9PLEO|nr:hypothetical protein CC78DRAFT_612993 [Didymosphaeria enalia]